MAEPSATAYVALEVVVEVSGPLPPDRPSAADDLAHAALWEGKTDACEVDGYADLEPGVVTMVMR